MNKINEVCNINIVLSEEWVLLGCVRGMKSDDALDFILLFAKYYIYACKLNNNLPDINVFMKRLQSTYLIDKYLSFSEMNNEQFEGKWQPYLNMFETE